MDLNVFLSITPRSDAWDPHILTYSSHEEFMTNYEGKVKPSNCRKFIVSSILSRTFDPSLFAYDLVPRSLIDNSLSYDHVAAVKSVAGFDSGLNPVQLAKI